MSAAGARAGRFTTGSTMRHVTVMTLTSSVGLTFMFLVDFATLFYISMLGEESLTSAVGYAWTIQFFTISVGIGFAIAATALVSRELGAKRTERARRYATSSITINFAVLLTTALAVLAFRYELLDILGATGATREVAARFLVITVPSLPMMTFGMAGSSILRAEGDARRAMYVTLFGGLTAMVLDPLFIFVFGLGVDGAAIVVVISRSVTGLAGLYYVIFVRRLAAPLRLAETARDVLPLMRVAAPATLTQLSTPFGNFLLTAAISAYGDSAVAGWAVISRLTVLMFGGIFALSGAIGGIVGQNYGARRFDRVAAAYRDALVFCVIYVLIGWALLAAFAGLVADGFSLSAEGAEVVRVFAYVGAGAFSFTGALFVSNAAFNNLGRPLWSTAFNWARDAAAIPLFLLFLPGMFLASGVIYAQAAAGVVVGSLAAWLGWRYVTHLRERHGGGEAEWGSAPAIASGRAATALPMEAAAAADHDPDDPFAEPASR